MLNSTHYMQLALNEARKAQILGEVPVGAVLVVGAEVVARGHNSPISSNDPSAHAEINVLREAGQALDNYRLSDSALFVTLEPCAMCLTAMVYGRIKRLVFGASDSKTGACGGCINLISNKCFNHKIEVVSGIMQAQCSALLSDFFRQKRGLN